MNRAPGLLLLRLGPAIVFLTSGALHLFGGEHDRAVALFMTVRIPFPETAAWFVGGLEFLGGLALLLGVGARPFALMLAAEMGVATFTVRLPQGVRAVAGYELVLMLTCLAIALLGPGRLSLPALFTRRA